ncbi:MAG: hypothetical protein JWO95_2767, partial [Verrucomicrobiales bacterium]|nr:hypothetical protein [Verrucomicrobiales bacterium]
QIDQRAIKIFLDWLRDDWLPRKQDPDFFVDYLVETTNGGEPSGFHFGVQIKGFEGSDREHPLSYSFRTKHLEYYLVRAQHPIFLFLVNVTTAEGYWVFAQEYIKNYIPAEVLKKQQTCTVRFVREDNLTNYTKFKCTLPQAERFVRDLHPVSTKAALQNRKLELETIDPRCEVRVSVQDGKEHVTINPKKTFSFKAKINSKNREGWKNFFERGAAVKVEPGELEFVGAPLLEQMNCMKAGGGTLQFGKARSGCIQYICKSDSNVSVIQIDCEFRFGTKYLTYKGRLENSPLEIEGEIPWELPGDRSVSSSINFVIEQWTGHPLLVLPYFHQIETLMNVICSKTPPEIHVLINGNVLWKGAAGNFESTTVREISQILDWLAKCRWLAQHFKVNPPLMPFRKIKNDEFENVIDMYHLANSRERINAVPGLRLTLRTNGGVTKEALSSGDRVLKVVKPTLFSIVLGPAVSIGPVDYLFTEMNCVSAEPNAHNSFKVILKGGPGAKRIVRFAQ